MSHSRRLSSALLLSGFSLLALGRRAIAASGAWEADRRLTFDDAHSATTFNFARSLAAEPDGRVEIVWYDDRDGTTQVYTRRSLDHGATWESDRLLSPGFVLAEHPAIASSGRTVLVAWHGREQGANGFDVFVRRSTDGGQTWNPVEALTSNHTAAHPSVAIVGRRAQLVWGENRSGFTEVVTRSSADAGATWEEERQLSAGRGAASWVATVEISGETVHAAWVDTQDGNEEESYRRSRDGGRTWEPALRLTRNGASSWAPSLAVAGSRVHLVWFDQADSPVQPNEAEAELDVVLRRLGLPVPPEPSGVLVPHPEEEARRRAGEKAQQIEAASPAWIAAGGDAARLRTILEQVQILGAAGASYLAKERKLDEGLRLLGLVYRPHPFPDVPLVDHGEALKVRVADKLQQVSEAAPAWVARGGDPFTLRAALQSFERHLDLALNEWEIYAKESRDGGRSWSADERLTRAPGDSRHVTLALVADELYAVWFDERDGNSEIYFKHRPRGASSGTPKEK